MTYPRSENQGGTVWLRLSEKERLVRISPVSVSVRCERCGQVAVAYRQRKGRFMWGSYFRPVCVQHAHAESSGAWGS